MTMLCIILYMLHFDLSLILLLVFFRYMQAGGAISNANLAILVITGSKFEGNASLRVGNHIHDSDSYFWPGDVTCNDGNTFIGLGFGLAYNDDSDGNFPAGLCTSTR
jgi:hypothetical protein